MLFFVTRVLVLVPQTCNDFHSKLILTDAQAYATSIIFTSTCNGITQVYMKHTQKTERVIVQFNYFNFFLALINLLPICISSYLLSYLLLLHSLSPILAFKYKYIYYLFWGPVLKSQQSSEDRMVVVVVVATSSSKEHALSIVYC